MSPEHYHAKTVGALIVGGGAGTDNSAKSPFLPKAIGLLGARLRHLLAQRVRNSKDWLNDYGATMSKQRFSVTMTVSVEAETPQEAAEAASAELTKSPPTKFDVVDESGSTFHVIREHPQRSVDTIESEVVQYPEFMENDAPPGAGG